MVGYRAAAHLGPHTAVVAVAEMKMSSVALYSGTQSAAGSLLLQWADDMALSWYTARDGDIADRLAGEVVAA